MKTLYYGDNGRITCGDLRCSGMTAFYSKMKRDMSGQKMAKVTPEDVRGFEAVGLKCKCETCGAETSLLVSA